MNVKRQSTAVRDAVPLSKVGYIAQIAKAKEQKKNGKEQSCLKNKVDV